MHKSALPCEWRAGAGSSSMWRVAFAAAAVTTALSLTACAHNRTVQNDYLTSSATSIDIARAAGADELAPVELNNARTKLERARMLAQSGKRAEAQELAEEADLDAQVAHSKATSERSARALIEVENGLRALREQATQQQAPASQQPDSQMSPSQSGPPAMPRPTPEPMPQPLR